MNQIVEKISRNKYDKNNVKIQGVKETRNVLYIPAVKEMLDNAVNRVGIFEKIGHEYDQLNILWHKDGLAIVNVNETDILYRSKSKEQNENYGKMMADARGENDLGIAVREGMCVLKDIKWSEGASDLLDKLSDSMMNALKVIDAAKFSDTEIENAVLRGKSYDTGDFCRHMRFILAGRLCDGRKLVLKSVRYLYSDVTFEAMITSDLTTGHLYDMFEDVRMEGGEFEKYVLTQVSKVGESHASLKLIQRVRYFGSTTVETFIKRGNLRILKPFVRDDAPAPVAKRAVLTRADDRTQREF